MKRKNLLIGVLSLAAVLILSSCASNNTVKSNSTNPHCEFTPHQAKANKTKKNLPPPAAGTPIGR